MKLLQTQVGTRFMNRDCDLKAKQTRPGFCSNNIKILLTSIYISFFTEDFQMIVLYTSSVLQSSRLHVLSLWSKGYAKRCTNNYLLSRDKQFFPLLFWLITCFLFQNMLSKNISCFRFWSKIYRKRCTKNYVISHIKGISLAAFCG